MWLVTPSFCKWAATVLLITTVYLRSLLRFEMLLLYSRCYSLLLLYPISFWHGYVFHEGTAYHGRVPSISQMTSRILRHTAAAMRAHNVLCNSYNSIRVEMNRCSFRRVRFALLYIVTHSKIVWIPLLQCCACRLYSVPCDMYTSCV
jgi:hypothetical protein